MQDTRATRTESELNLTPCVGSSVIGIVAAALLKRQVWFCWSRALFSCRKGFILLLKIWWKKRQLLFFSGESSGEAELVF